MTLYGFADDDEREVFEVVQTVSGVGPRLALAMLAVHSPDALRRAVDAEDLAALQRVPGIGKKGAQRIVLELAGKLGPASTAETVPQAVPASAGQDAVVDALVGLGWSAKVAADAVSAVSDGPVAPGEVAGVLRAALQHLGGQRG
jgi:Holliday junction DNA helicase RuvA